MAEQATDAIAKASNSLSLIHQLVLPNSEVPSTFGELAEVFNSDATAVEMYGHQQTVSGSQTTFLLLVGHGVEGNFEAAVADFPKGPDGKSISLQPHLKRSSELAHALGGTLERRAAEKAAKAAKKKAANTS